jgi:hypothetical protein
MSGTVAYVPLDSAKHDREPKNAFVLSGKMLVNPIKELRL